jgi:diacylglycerol kinase family enzyme
MAAGGVACTGFSGEDYAVPGRNALVLQTSDPLEFVGLFRTLRTNPAEEAALRLAELARANGADAVIAAGGDGTFRAVATGAAGSELPVGFVPLGTGNVLAYEFGVRKRAADIAKGLLDHPAIPVQGGTVNGQPFFLMAGAGHDARIVHGLNYKTKRMFGRAAYTQPVLKALIHRPEMFDVDVDGRCFSASWVIVTRASHYGGSFIVTRETQLGASPMIAVIVDAKTRTQLLAASAALALGWIANPVRRPSGVTVLPARHVQIGLSADVPLQVDGDEAGATPADIVAEGPVVRVIVPPAYAADLTKRHTNHLLLDQ